MRRCRIKRVRIGGNAWIVVPICLARLFKLVEPIADATHAHTLRERADGSFELGDQPCPHEG
jgi:hypothetical protein